LCIGSIARADADDDAMLKRVQDLLRAHQADVFGCVAKQAKPPEGEVLIRVFVGDGGQVARADVLKANEGAAPLKHCLLDKVNQWDLSPLGASPGDQVVFPLAFKPPSPHVKAADVPTLPIAGGKGTAKLMLDGAGAPLALDRLTAEKGTKMPPHKHDDSDEYLYILAGRGTTTVGTQIVKWGPGDALFIPKGTEHSTTIDEKLDAVQVYSPAGPEQRFKQK
jgi:mannose-6-phosphate isomerase-like protein (cupin superfamily)